ncbi:hypothetical protein TSUD_123610 [Trifolium subterraneum]|uniref:Uncharacterized protein n=1 Tax=Trifolium subterraneum TaxID=3900 RepID=A0A2Z6LSW3_TRISU|nr:hypothetical protein TSUD_123610 [Trifolium subterraneum]
MREKLNLIHLRYKRDKLKLKYHYHNLGLFKNNYCLKRGPVVYPDGFGVRPPPVRGPPPVTAQPPIHAPTPFPQLRGATPAAGPPPIRVPFPKSGFSTNEPDFMYFIPNPVMRPSYPK